MANINNPHAVRFCNEQVRVLADTLLSAFRTAQAVRDYYYAHPELGSLFYANQADAVEDGSATDGRPVLTGNDVLLMITRADELVSDLTASSNAKLNALLRVAVNGGNRVR